MLHLILGRAKSGKTAAVLEAIAGHVRRGEAPVVLIVPEQYSHEAERELLRVCGDGLSLCAEVLSFTRLYARVEAELGFGGRRTLDKGGRLLALARALTVTETRLHGLAAARRSAPMQTALMEAIDELKMGGVAPAALERTAAALAAEGEPLAEKLQDLALVCEAYDAVVARSGLDPMDRLTVLAGRIGESRLARGRIYIDGFTDFTAQQNAVLAALLRAGAEVTVCLSCEGLQEGHEIFEPSRRAALKLQKLARDADRDWDVTVRPPREGDGPLELLERELFAFGPVEADAGGRVTLRCAADLNAECEAAAQRCLELAQSGGCRWRDIALCARDMERYCSTLEGAFARYGVPLYLARRSALLSKPLPSLITGAYACVCRGWDYEDVMAYCKTGLAGLSGPECDTLEDYAFLWTLHGRAWSQDEDWALHPAGFGLDFSEEDRLALRDLNALRRRAMAPLWLLRARGTAATTAAQQAAALADYFQALSLPEQLERRATELEDLGMAQEAAEYAQLWDIVTGALRQCVAILGDTEMGQEDFGALFALVLSAYDLGSIPLSLDKVSAGDMERVRSRHVKHLIVLGCDSETLPRSEAPGGLFSDRDREALNAAGLELGDTAEGRLRREFALIYNCLTLPAESLCLSWCSAGGEAGQSAPSFVLRRCESIFRLPIETVDLRVCRSWAPGPARELAAMAGRETAGALHRAARRWFEAKGEGEALRRLEIAANLGRGSLSRRAVRALYGPRPRLSASRVEKLSDCAFAFFMRYGLLAKPRQPAGFKPPEKGSFLHDILEHVARDVQARGGFAAVERAEVEALCDEHVARYVHEKLFDFRQKNARFVYLFRRLTREVRAIVADMAEELRRSDFVPLDFELDFGDRGAFPPLELGEGEDTLVLTGVADRVDGWSHDGKLYLRVVDYKTGHKKFSLSDVWYGMGLQMLLYLFALEREGAARYGGEIVPAGVLYVPARDELIQSGSRLTPEKILEEKAKRLNRSGLLLNDPAVLEAMEHGDRPRYLPVKYNRLDEGSLASAERLGVLSRHVDKTLRALAATLQRGSIEADPWFRSQTENACRYCDWAEACHFDERRDRRRCLVSMKTEEVWQKLEEGGADHGL